MKTFATSMALAFGLALAAGSAGAVTVYGVDGNDRLLTFDSNNPGVFTSSVQISGATGFLGLDFRPLNRQLYGLGSDRVVYVINPVTGVATAQGSVLAFDAGSTHFGFDFNPTIDRLRITTNANPADVMPLPPMINNYVFNPNTNALQPTPVVQSLAFRAGDVNFGNKNIDLIANAYTTSVFGAPGASTQLYGLDAANGILTRVQNSAGFLDTVGSLGVSIGLRSSFDIQGTDALVQDGRNLYAVNLNTGKLTLKGRTDESLFGIAIAPVPEPSSWALMIAGFGMAGSLLRRGRAAAVKA